MIEISNIVEGIFGLIAAVYFTLYLTGKLKYSEANEKKRVDRVKKYGWLLLIVTISAYILSVVLIISAF